MWRPIFIITFLVACYVTSEKIKYEMCKDITSPNCTISNVRVTPCAEAERGAPCVIQKGKYAIIEFDYTGPTGAKDLTTLAYWKTWPVDLPLVGMDSDGCKHTVCPTTGSQEHFTYNLTINKKFPTKSFDVKWRLYQEDEMECCFVFKIKLVPQTANAG